MDNQFQQATDYIREQFGQGFGEAEIRAHLLNNGWPQTAVDQAFQQFHGVSLTTPQQSVPATDLGATAYKTPATGSKRKRIIVIAIAVLVVLGVSIYAVSSSKPTVKTHTQVTSTTTTTKPDPQSLDVSHIAAAIKNFETSHSGLLPRITASDTTANTLDICGADCTSANEVTVVLTYYHNTQTAVSFHMYVSGLSVPNAQTLYIVNNADCNSSNTGIGTHVTLAQNPGVVLLYATSEGSNTAQKCQSV